MNITKEQRYFIEQMFRFVSPSVDIHVKRWIKGDVIDLNSIYEYRDAHGRPIAIWTDFEGLSDVRITRILKKINTVPHVFFLEHFQNRIRIGFKVKKELRLDDTINRISPE